MEFLYEIYHLNKKNDDLKIVGRFTSLKEVKKIIEEYKQYEGFKDNPNGFFIDKYEINKLCWQDGYFKKQKEIKI